MNGEHGTVRLSPWLTELADEQQHTELPRPPVPSRDHSATLSGCTTASV